ncbi:uncharacterized protein [Malus domestica]|uniref:uncharacterized protein n=1 Tax=Malus domestica TaxID=3750 RepID=UPI0039753717
MTIWYEILVAVNEVSKDLQYKDMLIDVAIEQVQGLIAYFEKYGETGFVKAMINAKKLAIEMEIDPRRFEEYEAYDDIFGFLFTSERLNSIDNDKLKDCCDWLQNFLKKDELFDVDGEALLVELKLLRERLPKEIKTSIDILNYLKSMRCFPTASIAYKILLTIPITVASAKRSFLKVKVIKIILAVNHVAGKFKWTSFDID